MGVPGKYSGRADNVRTVIGRRCIDSEMVLEQNKSSRSSYVRIIARSGFFCKSAKMHESLILSVTLQSGVFDLPVNRLPACRFKKMIHLGERTAPEKPSVSGQRAGVWTLQNQMLRIVQHHTLFLSASSPQ